MYEFNFLNPEYFFLLLFVLLIIILEFFYLKLPIFNKLYKKENIDTSIVQTFYKKRSLKYYFYYLPFVLRILSLILLCIAIARPISKSNWNKTYTEAIDIVIALDISTSMLAQDFNPNRLEAAKTEALEFIKLRDSDRFGLVVFSGEAFSQCPLTTDHNVLNNLIKEITPGLIADGTAIGIGLATATNRLKESIAKSKVIILLTDGVNNAGEIDPITVSRICKELGIKVYTIAVGTIGKAPYPFKDEFGRVFLREIDVEIDVDLLKSIAETTGGKFYRATGNNKLKNIYKEIDLLEKTKIEVEEHHNKVDDFFWFAYIAGALLLFEKLLKYTYFRSLT